MTATLYDLGNGRDILDEWLSESDGEVTAELEALLSEWEAGWDWKAERVALYILELKRLADAAKFEADRLADIARARNKAADSLKLYLHREMERVGKSKVAGSLATIAVQRNPPRVVGEIDAETLAAWYQRPLYLAYVRHTPEAYTLNRTELLAAFKAGSTLPEGLSVEQSSSIRIR